MSGVVTIWPFFPDKTRSNFISVLKSDETLRIVNNIKVIYLQSHRLFPLKALNPWSKEGAVFVPSK